METFLRRQDPADLVALLLELAETHESVRARLERMLLADRPGKLAADFKNTLSRWKRSRKFYQYREAREFARTLSGWLDQVARELLPRDAAAAVSLFEAFIEADATWFEHADDSDGVIGEAVREACRYWLQAAARCESSPAAWSQRMVDLYATDGYGARKELLRRADLLFDESALRELVARFDSRLEKTLDAIPDGEKPSSTVFRLAAALSLLAEALRDPDIMVRATLRYRPDPNSVQRQKFAEAYLQAGRRPTRSRGCGIRWEHIDQRRQDLLAEALERLGRFDESLPMRRRMFEGSPTAFNFQRCSPTCPSGSVPPPWPMLTRSRSATTT
ncbi:MAG: hypothetical protein HC882_02685, partial [Acidobacteria bacterium]|nr:hypothetical protein [Acidobacteriota bacterium]